MNILTIDSTEKQAKLSLETNGKQDYLNLQENENHSEFLLYKLDELLTRNSLTINDTNFVAINLGPGSFTGVRIGVCFAKAFMLSLKIKAISVNAFELVAENLDDENYMIILNSNNDDVYFSTKLNGKISYGTMNIIKISDFAKNNNLKIYCKDVEEKYFEKISAIKIKIEDDTMLKIAKEKIEKNDFCEINSLNPLYIKKSQAERELKQKITSCINIIKAEVENLDDVLCLENNFSEPYTEELLKNELNSENREYYLAKYKDYFVGYIGFEICFDGINLLKICVKNEFRNLGIAKILMQKMFETAKLKNLNKLFLEVDEKNIDAIKLYESLGFKTEYSRHKYYKNGNDALIMFKYL